MRVIFIALLLLLSANNASAQDLDIQQAILRLPPPVSDTTAAYANIYNRSDTSVTITAIHTAIAAKTMMHAISIKHGGMHMASLPSITVPAHGMVAFSIDRQHMMLMGLKRRLHAGEKINMVLQLKKGKTQAFFATVTDLR